ncbi:winged helix-turn-helix transcriptional regulator [bacterium]|nr:winged helix-turn-helix transcriptional regulator [bacterium]
MDVVTAPPCPAEPDGELRAPGPAVLADRLIRLVRKLRTQESNSLYDFAMGPAQLAMLEIIAANPGLRMRVVAQALGVDRAAVTRAVRGLERNGFVVRRRGERDRRAWELFATRSGRWALQSAEDPLLCPAARLVAGLDTADRRQLEDYLARMDASLDVPVAERWRRLVLGGALPQATDAGPPPAWTAPSRASGFPPRPCGC